jgi:transcriptional regulator
MLPGTLAMLILSLLQHGALHGYAIGRRIRELSGGRLQIEEGSLYPALRRLQVNGCIQGRWRISETNRKVRVYQLTTKGRTQLQVEITCFNRQIQAIQEVLTNL